MRTLLLSLLSGLLVCSTFAQPSPSQVGSDSSSVMQIQYTKLDELEKNYANILTGNQGSITFKLVELRNLVTNQAIRGVEVTIQQQDRQRVGTSLAFAAVGSMWGASTNVTYERIRDSGYTFLDSGRLNDVVDFLDDVIGATGSDHDHLKLYKVSLQEGFELGMRYDPSNVPGSQSRGLERPEWKFIVTSSDATYTLDYQDGVDVVRTLANWRKQVSEHQAQASK